MSQLVYLTNTNVELEYAGKQFSNIEQSLSSNQVCLQLQFLPLLYANHEDIVAVTALPDENYIASCKQKGLWLEGMPNLALMHDVEPFLGKTCESWGPSQLIQAWAYARRMEYPLPKDWDVTCQINSKAFSFRYTCLPQAALLNCEKELSNWVKQVEGPKVLKTCFGLSGKGNLTFEALSPNILSLLSKRMAPKTTHHWGTLVKQNR